MNYKLETHLANQHFRWYLISVVRPRIASVPLVDQKSHNNTAKEYRSASDLISKYI